MKSYTLIATKITYESRSEIINKYPNARIDEFCDGRKIISLEIPIKINFFGKMKGKVALYASKYDLDTFSVLDSNKKLLFNEKEVLKF